MGDRAAGAEHFFGERAVGLPQTLLKLTQFLTYLASEDRAWEPWCHLPPGAQGKARGGGGGRGSRLVPSHQQGRQPWGVERTHLKTVYTSDNKIHLCYIHRDMWFYI